MGLGRLSTFPTRKGVGEGCREDPSPPGPPQCHREGLQQRHGNPKQILGVALVKCIGLELGDQGEQERSQGYPAPRSCCEAHTIVLPTPDPADAVRENERKARRPEAAPAPPASLLSGPPRSGQGRVAGGCAGAWGRGAGGGRGECMLQP